MGLLEVPCNFYMNITIDTSAILAVIVGESVREKIVRMTAGNTLIAPGSIPWEIGNAFSAMLKRDRIALSEAQKGISIFNLIQIRYIETDFDNALSLSKTLNVYAYDAYILDYAMRSNSSLLTLDNKLLDAARKLGITSLEV